MRCRSVRRGNNAHCTSKKWEKQFAIIASNFSDIIIITAIDILFFSYSSPQIWLRLLWLHSVTFLKYIKWSSLLFYFHIEIFMNVTITINITLGVVRLELLFRFVFLKWMLQDLKAWRDIPHVSHVHNCHFQCFS